MHTHTFATHRAHSASASRRQEAAAAPAPAAHRARVAASQPATKTRASLGPGAQDADYGRADAGIASRGPVRKLQADLAALGHFHSRHGYTGGYFKETTAAVKAFQQANGLTASGKADAATLAKLADLRAAQGPSTGARPVPSRPASAPAAPVAPPVAPKDPPAKRETRSENAGIERLKHMSREELARLGATDKKAFFDALRPSAEAAERAYGVPAEVTLIQAAYESGWGKHVPGGNSNNIFGVKGRGPAGSVQQSSWEANHSYKKVSSFAKYNDLHEAVMAHGKLFHNGNYTKALNGLAKGQTDAASFLRNIEGDYHQDGHAYTVTAMNMIRKYNI